MSLPPYDRLLADISLLPEAVMRPGHPPAGRSPRVVTPVYGSIRRSFSGSTWHLAQAGMAEAVLEGAFTLNTDARSNARLQMTGAIWKLQRSLRGQKSGGFKFVQMFNDVLWSQYISRLAGTVIINNTQLYTRRFLEQYRRCDISPCFYIDGTLTEYFYSYGQVEGQAVGPDIVRRAIEMERESYAHATCIMTMSRATRQNLVEVYNVSPERVVVVAPGANIDDDVVPAPSAHRGWVGAEFTLGFVGLFPLRKGLDRLAGAVRILRSRGAPIRLRVIGRCPDEIAAMDGVEFLGAIDKATAAPRFVEAIRTVDVGCQLSHAELLGIAMLEFIRVGVPVIATNVGGMPDVLADGGGMLVPSDITAEHLAEELHALMTDQARYQSLRDAAVGRSVWASWRRAAQEIDAALIRVG